MKEKLKNRTAAYLWRKALKRLRVGDVVMFHLSPFTSKHDTGVIERILPWGVITKKYRIPHSLIFKKITRQAPEYLL